MAADMLVFGRRARGERFERGFLHDRWEVHVGRRLAWADVLRLAPEPGELLNAPFGFAGAAAFATCIYVAPDAADRVGLARDLAAWSDVQSGATHIGPMLIVRWPAGRSCVDAPSTAAILRGFPACGRRLAGAGSGDLGT